MAVAAAPPEVLLDRAVQSGRVHSAYLLSGPPDSTRPAALRFARSLACENGAAPPCDACPACQRSTPGDPIALDGNGRKGPFYRHLGDHPDLFWLERGETDTRVRIGQIRALQQALRLRSHGGGRRAVVIADAEWLNQEAQNALLRTLEEPPPDTTLVLVARTASGLLATVRSRCLRVRFPEPLRPLHGPEAPDGVEELQAQLEQIETAGVPELLDRAELFRGGRGQADRVELLLQLGADWLRARVHAGLAQGRDDFTPELAAFSALSEGRKGLVQHNANPQMVAERALFALRRAAAG